MSTATAPAMEAVDSSRRAAVQERDHESRKRLQQAKNPGGGAMSIGTRECVDPRSGHFSPRGL